MGDVEWYELMKSGKPQVFAVERLAEMGRRLWSMTRKKAPPHLKLFALLTKAAGELALLIHKHAGLSMNWKAQKKLGRDPLWIAVLAGELNSNFAAIGKKYKQCLRLATIAAASPHRWSVSAAITKIAKEVPTLVGILETSDLADLAEQYRQSGFQLFRMGAQLAIDNNDIDALWRASTLVLLLEKSIEGKIFKWSREMVGMMREGNDYRTRADQFTQNVIDRWQGKEVEGDIKTTARQVHENILASFGIDPLSEPWPEVVELAIRDSDAHCFRNSK